MTTISELLREERLHEEKGLVRGLKTRHIQMIAMGGAIGVGLFLDSARAIQAAGPAQLLSCALVGMLRSSEASIRHDGPWLSLDDARQGPTQSDSAHTITSWDSHPVGQVRRARCGIVRAILALASGPER